MSRKHNIRTNVLSSQTFRSYLLQRNVFEYKLSYTDVYSALYIKAKMLMQSKQVLYVKSN
jgi:hypothetical protein